MHLLPGPSAENAGVRFDYSSRPSAAHAATRCSRGVSSAPPSSNALVAGGSPASLTPRAQPGTTKGPCAQSSTRSSTKDGVSSPARCRHSCSRLADSYWRAPNASFPYPFIRGDGRAEASTRRKISRGTWSFQCGAPSGACVPRHHRLPWTPERGAETSAAPSASLPFSRPNDVNDGWKAGQWSSSMTCGRPGRRSRHAPQCSKPWACERYGR